MFLPDVRNNPADLNASFCYVPKTWCSLTGDNVWWCGITLHELTDCITFTRMLEWAQLTRLCGASMRDDVRVLCLADPHHEKKAYH